MTDSGNRKPPPTKIFKPLDTRCEVLSSTRIYHPFKQTLQLFNSSTHNPKCVSSLSPLPPSSPALPPLTALPARPTAVLDPLPTPSWSATRRVSQPPSPPAATARHARTLAPTTDLPVLKSTDGLGY